MKSKLISAFIIFSIIVASSVFMFGQQNDDDSGLSKLMKVSCGCYKSRENGELGYCREYRVFCGYASSDERAENIAKLRMSYKYKCNFDNVVCSSQGVVKECGKYDFGW